MKLKRLALENFRGIKALQIDFNDDVTTIYGANGTGKTTVANAICWLLTDSPATGEKDFTPKTAQSHNLDHRAALEVEKDTGELVRIGKSYHEVWKKKRGSAAPEFSGHVTDYAINGVPAKKKDYEAALELITGGDTERTKVLLLAGYFAESLKDEDRRRVLFEVCGNVDDEMVLQEVPDLKPFLLIPGGTGTTYSPEERKKIATKERQEYNKKLAELPARIDELARTLPEVIGQSVEDVKELIKAKQAELAKVKAGKQADDRRAALKAVLAGIDAEEKKLLKEHMAAWKAKHDDESKTVELLGRESIAAENKHTALRDRCHTIASAIAENKRSREALLAQFSKIRAEVWNEADGCCPACRRAYEPDKVEQMRAAFMENRAARLAELNAKGQKCSAAVIAAQEAELTQVEADREAARLACEAKDREYKVAFNTYMALEPAEADFAQSYAAADINDRREKIKRQLANIQDDDTAQEEMLAAEIESLIFKMSEVQQTENTIKRMGQLEDEKLTAAAGLEQAERVIYLCEEFTRAKVRMVTDRINEKFTSVRWLLFREQINGGLKECCEPLIPNAQGTAVEYRSANTAAQVNAGMEIIKVLGQHYGTHMPVLVDRAESVCELLEIPEQTVRLVVSAEDKTLRFSNN